MPKPKPKPQVTLITVAVTTDGPVPMKAVREVVGITLETLAGFKIAGAPVTKVRVKRDAHVDTPR